MKKYPTSYKEKFAITDAGNKSWIHFSEPRESFAGKLGPLKIVKNDPLLNIALGSLHTLF